MDNTGTARACANVRAEMARRKISQDALAKQVGMKQATISMRLNGHTPFTLDDLVKIAAALDVSLETLLDGVAA